MIRIILILLFMLPASCAADPAQRDRQMAGFMDFVNGALTIASFVR